VFRRRTRANRCACCGVRRGCARWTRSAALAESARTKGCARPSVDRIAIAGPSTSAERARRDASACCRQSQTQGFDVEAAQSSALGAASTCKQTRRTAACARRRVRHRRFARWEAARIDASAARCCVARSASPWRRIRATAGSADACVRATTPTARGATTACARRFAPAVSRTATATRRARARPTRARASSTADAARTPAPLLECAAEAAACCR